MRPSRSPLPRQHAAAFWRGGGWRPPATQKPRFRGRPSTRTVCALPRHNVAHQNTFENTMAVPLPASLTTAALPSRHRARHQANGARRLSQLAWRAAGRAPRPAGRVALLPPQAVAQPLGPAQHPAQAMGATSDESASPWEVAQGYYRVSRCQDHSWLGGSGGGSSGSTCPRGRLCPAAHSKHPSTLLGLLPCSPCLPACLPSSSCEGGMRCHPLRLCCWAHGPGPARRCLGSSTLQVGPRSAAAGGLL